MLPRLEGTVQDRRRPRRALAQGQAEVEALERRLAEAQDAEGRAQADLRDAEQALADRLGRAQRVSNPAVSMNPDQQWLYIKLRPARVLRSGPVP